MLTEKKKRSSDKPIKINLSNITLGKSNKINKREKAPFSARFDRKRSADTDTSTDFTDNIMVLLK